VGSGGAAINRIRDSLGVSIVFDHDSDETQKDITKKKKIAQQKSHVKVSACSYMSLQMMDLCVIRSLVEKRMPRKLDTAFSIRLRDSLMKLPRSSRFPTNTTLP
jgi:hypothetical protein